MTEAAAGDLLGIHERLARQLALDVGIALEASRQVVLMRKLAVQIGEVAIGPEALLLEFGRVASRAAESEDSPDGERRSYTLGPPRCRYSWR